MVGVDSDIDCRQIFRITEEEVRAIEVGDSEKYFALLSADAVFMPPNVAAKTGDDLRNWMRDFLERVSINLHHFAHGETIVCGDLACHAYTCSWTAAPRSGGTGTLMFFKGMHVLQRHPDGSWKITRNIWNTDPKPDQ